MTIQPSVLIRLWCRLSFLEDVLRGEERFPHRTWLFRQTGGNTFYGVLSTQHNETWSELAAWISGRADGQVVLAGVCYDCPWLEDRGPDVEAAVRNRWEQQGVPGLKLPPHDRHGTVGWSVAVEAATIVQEWQDVSWLDPKLEELDRIIRGTLGEDVANPTALSLSMFRACVRGNPQLTDVVARVIAGDKLSEEDEGILAIAVPRARVREIRQRSGFDFWAQRKD